MSCLRKDEREKVAWKESVTLMTWKELSSLEDLNLVDQLSNSESVRAVALFKHSTRCSISSMAKSRIERNWGEILGDVEIFHLDLLNHRDVSNEIANRYGVQHESPQLLLIKNGKCILHKSHHMIDVQDLSVEL